MSARPRFRLRAPSPRRRRRAARGLPAPAARAVDSPFDVSAAWKTSGLRGSTLRSPSASSVFARFFLRFRREPSSSRAPSSAAEPAAPAAASRSFLDAPALGPPPIEAAITERQSLYSSRSAGMRSSAARFSASEYFRRPTRPPRNRAPRHPGQPPRRQAAPTPRKRRRAPSDVSSRMVMRDNCDARAVMPSGAGLGPWTRLRRLATPFHLPTDMAFNAFPTPSAHAEGVRAEASVERRRPCGRAARALLARVSQAHGQGRGVAGREPPGRCGRPERGRRRPLPPRRWL